MYDFNPSNVSVAPVEIKINERSKGIIGVSLVFPQLYIECCSCTYQLSHFHPEDTFESVCGTSFSDAETQRV
jgi:hypothetical protein